MLLVEGSQEILTSSLLGPQVSTPAHTLIPLLASLLCSRKAERQNRLHRENTPVIECVASSACFVQSWEKGLGRAQRSRLVSAEAKLYEGLKLMERQSFGRMSVQLCFVGVQVMGSSF